MFDALKKKIAGWFKKPEETEEKPVVVPVKEAKKGKEEILKEIKKLKPAKKSEVKKELEVETLKKIEKAAKKTISVDEEIDILALQEKKEVEEKTKIEEAEIIKEQAEPEKEQAQEKPAEEGFFSKLFKKITRSTVTLTQEHLDELFSELEITLLENNVALEVADKIKENLSKDLVGIEVKKDEIEKTIKDSLKKSILAVLIEPPNLINKIKDHPGIYTIIFFGINGTGKTTSIAKLASLLKKNNISCVLAAADTFRAASIEQLQKHGDKLSVPVISHAYGTDPASIAFDAKKYAEKNKIKVVLIDTAGRMHTKQNLMKEMEKIIRISKPNLKIFVGESITGNDVIDQAKIFNETIGIDGIILTKADVDEKAGTILSVSYVTGQPIYFLGIGQEYDDLEVFTKSTVLKNLGLE